MYKKEILALLKKIPKEHNKTAHKLIELSFIEGVKSVQEILTGVVSIPPNAINEYGIYHESNLDGG